MTGEENSVPAMRLPMDGELWDESGIDEEDIGQIVRPFDPEKIKVITESRSLDLILKRISYDEIDLAPEFQRRARVWSDTKKSQLIESLLLRIPLPVFYVSAEANGNWSVVDGLQRLTTINDFVDNRFELSSLEYLKDLDGYVFERLPRALKRRIEETIIVIHIIEPGTPEDVMFNIFKRINTGGEPLRPQEIRNALAKGPVRKFLKTLAESQEFLSATQETVKDKRLDAQECAARFCAFFMTPYHRYGDGDLNTDLDTFILRGMKGVSAMPEEGREELARSFYRAMDAADAILGRYAFRKFSLRNSGRGPVSKALFEATSVNLARLPDAALDQLTKRRDEVIERFARLMEQPAFFASISSTTGDRARVRERFSALETMFSEIVK